MCNCADGIAAAQEVGHEVLQVFLTASGVKITSTEITMARRNSSPGSDCSSRCAHLHANEGPENGSNMHHS